MGAAIGVAIGQTIFTSVRSLLVSMNVFELSYIVSRQTFVGDSKLVHLDRVCFSVD